MIHPRLLGPVLLSMAGAAFLACTVDSEEPTGSPSPSSTTADGGAPDGDELTADASAGRDAAEAPCEAPPPSPSAGTLDPAFASGDKTVSGDFGGLEEPHQITGDGAGGVYVTARAVRVSYGSGSGSDVVAVLHIRGDGSLDAGFGASSKYGGKGVFADSFGKRVTYPLALAGDSAGRPLVAGAIGSISGPLTLFLIRLTKGGLLDPSFAAASPVPGVAFFEVSEKKPFGLPMISLSVGEAGDAFVAGGFSLDGASHGFIRHVRADGTLDASASVDTESASANVSLSSVLAADGGTLFVGGPGGILHILSDGTNDMSFGSKGVAKLEDLGVTSPSWLRQDRNRRLVVAGGNASTSHKIGRLSPSGAVDATFKPFFDSHDILSAELLCDGTFEVALRGSGNDRDTVTGVALGPDGSPLGGASAPYRVEVDGGSPTVEAAYIDPKTRAMTFVAERDSATAVWVGRFRR